jgi:ubiquitin-conjugating enzyme E2 Q
MFALTPHHFLDLPSMIGVYFAKDGSTSMGGYAQGSSNTWRHSQIAPRCCVAVAEIVNQPSKFVSNNPHYVVNDTNWIIW